MLGDVSLDSFHQSWVHWGGAPDFVPLAFAIREPGEEVKMGMGEPNIIDWFEELLVKLRLGE